MSLNGVTRPGSGSGSEITNPGRHSPIRMQNRIAIEQVRKGKVINSQTQEGNIMVTYGLNRLIEMMASDTGGASAYANTLAIGQTSTTPTSTDTALASSKQLCDTFTRSDLGNMTARYLGTFNSGDGAATIQEVGLFQTNSATSSLIARASFASIDRANADEIRVSYDLIASTA